MLDRRPRLAYPFTILTQPDTVRLVAGEDHRYTLTGPRLEQWLPPLLARFTGSAPVEALLADLPEERRQHARDLVARLYGERVLIDGTAVEAHVARPRRWVVEGRGSLCDRVRAVSSVGSEGASVRVLCQDRLDYAEALAAQRAASQAGGPYLWASTAAMSRGYVSPLFLPDAGPCLGCLLGTFRRLSPAPELYDALVEHGQQGKAFEPVAFDEAGVAILAALVEWKLACLDRDDAPAALYRLHVLDLATMEATSHRVFLDPECPECHGGRG